MEVVAPGWPEHLSGVASAVTRGAPLVGGAWHEP